MRIAQVCPYSLSVPGGVQEQVLGLARALRAQGHEARVLAPCDGPPPDTMVTSLGKSVPTASNGSMAPIAPDPACAMRTIHALRNEGFDILHLHEPIVPGPTGVSLFVSDLPMLGTFHAAGANLAYTYMPWLTKRMAKKLKIRVAVSEEARSTAARHLGGQYEMLYNGIEVQRFATATPTPNKVVQPAIFFVGRHEPRKGLKTLIDAMPMLPKAVQLWIAGVGPQTAELRSLTAGDPRVQWLGRITDAEKAQRLRGASVFCAPSIEGESFGVVLLEAMAAGTPVVASNLPGYRNVVRGDVDALLFEPGNSAQLAAAVTRLLENQELAESLCHSGAKRAEEFSMDRLAEEYVKLYERCIGGYPFPV